MLADKRREKGREGESVGMNGLEGLILRLLEGRSDRGKRVQLTEHEIRQLCVTAKQVFLAQPVLLELEAPINICGTFFLLLLFLQPISIFTRCINSLALFIITCLVSVILIFHFNLSCTLHRW